MGEALDRAARSLREAGVPDARRAAEAILAHVLGTDRGGVMARRPEKIPETIAIRFDALLDRRRIREPFQYLTGEAEFLGLPFVVDPRVLVPRPETEELVESFLAWDPPRGSSVVDLGTGSGCIAVSVAVRRPDLKVLGVDRSAPALELARENAARNGATERVTFVEADFAALPVNWDGRFHAVISNPPYVSEEEWHGLDPEVRDHEPREALVPGPTGLEAYQALAPVAFRVLAGGGVLFVELGWKSASGARAAFEAAGFSEIETIPDVRGIGRILRGQKNAA